jgi:alpha-glucosidase/alpha-D-xyloside xylohydrolase
MAESNVIDLRAGHGEFQPGDDVKGRPLTIFVSAWDTPQQALAEYTRIAGDTPLPPKWSLGYMQSHRTLEGPEQIRQVARTFREKNLPADALIYLGRFTPRGWNQEERPFSFNPETFTNPGDILEDLHSLNFNAVVHTYGGTEGLHGTSMDAPSSDSSHIANYWQQHVPLIQTGVDAWWPDGGEPLSSEARVARHRMYRLGPLSVRPNERPWSFHRTGYSGAHRYGGWMWSGDVDSYWKTLETQIAVGLNHTVSLTPFWGSDTGGFLPSVELTGELYTRWFQFSAFCSSFRSHGRAWHLRLPWGWNAADLGPPELDAFSDAFEGGYPRPDELRNGLVEPIARTYLQLRYRLLPYNYTLVRQTHDTGLPPMRAMWLHYPADSVAVRQDDQYLWGRNLLVAPVHTQGATHRTLYLPEGTWYDFWTNETRAGGDEITRQVDLATMPIFVRAGAILPMAPVRQHVGEEVDEPYTVRIYPGRDGTFRWYRDDGRTLDYQDGEYSWTRLHWDNNERALTLAPAPRSDGEGPDPISLRIKVVGVGATGGTTRSVQWDGSRLSVTLE